MFHQHSRVICSLKYLVLDVIISFRWVKSLVIKAGVTDFSITKPGGPPSLKYLGRTLVLLILVPKVKKAAQGGMLLGTCITWQRVKATKARAVYSTFARDKKQGTNHNVHAKNTAGRFFCCCCVTG